ncbi:hypothetical protein FISHEDRAFT_74996 [Fistulina hepatica ATCC 64428]|uniref:Myb-like domain-containing protein n=1 Tax=Fistulina hepatica ATCC 64428 TaxID=1128425 RepID=A0A0D7A8F9_9AGAR|nr:hypothetical protein FISHEDRAFT_74996 [Fistulina hepatica ATCC 64428]
MSAATLTSKATSTVSFKAPLGPAEFKVPAVPSSTLKQRRVSLALPASPAKNMAAWDFRDDTGLASSTSAVGRKSKARRVDGEDEELTEKKPRRRWTDDETQMLVNGCNKHGVGNWKSILEDPELKFENRTPVDLKDRFRTHFPDAYKQYYPNAKTHLSTKVRSTNPDGTPLFEKSRMKKRRPFTEEEDRALKAGYDRYGTVWATIAKDPVFQNRRSTDLRDRFRNAFPELYTAAGYKPRTPTSSRKRGVAAPAAVMTPDSDASGYLARSASVGRSSPLKFKIHQVNLSRASTDDHLDLSSTTASEIGPKRRRRRAHTTQGLGAHRGGIKSVPQSAVATEDELSSGDEDDAPLAFAPAPMSAAAEQPVQMQLPQSLQPQAQQQDSAPAAEPASNGNTEMSLINSEEEQCFVAEAPAGVITPTGTAAGSPISDCVMMQDDNARGMIGKSAWEAQDWFSANPRMDSGSSASSSYVDVGTGVLEGLDGLDGLESLSPSSPFSFPSSPYSSSFPQLPLSPFNSPFTLSPFAHAAAERHNLLDRLDLFPSSHQHQDIVSDIGVGETHSTFSDDVFAPSNMGLRGFTHHSDTAGDLIFGARTHPARPPLPPPLPAGPTRMQRSVSQIQQRYYQSFADDMHMPQDTGIHPMQLHTVAPMQTIFSSFPLVDGLTGIRLDDSHDTDHIMADGTGSEAQLSFDELVDLPNDGVHPGTTTTSVSLSRDTSISSEPSFSMPGEQSMPSQSTQSTEQTSFSSHCNTSPPNTPITRHRPLRMASGYFHQNTDNEASLHMRSTSVPPFDSRDSVHDYAPVSASSPMRWRGEYPAPSSSQSDYGHPSSSQGDYGHSSSSQSEYGLPSGPAGDYMPSSSRSEYNPSSSQSDYTPSRPLPMHSFSQPEISTVSSSKSSSRPVSMSLSPQTMSYSSPPTLSSFNSNLSVYSSSSDVDPASIPLPNPMSPVSQYDAPASNATPRLGPTTLPDVGGDLSFTFDSSANTWGAFAGSNSLDYTLSFLDLHYYGHPMSGDPNNELSLDTPTTDRQGQALDLASSSTATAAAAAKASPYSNNLRRRSMIQQALSVGGSPPPLHPTPPTVVGDNVAPHVGLGRNALPVPGVPQALTGAMVVSNERDRVRKRSHQRGQSVDQPRQDSHMDRRPQTAYAANVSTSACDSSVKRKRASWGDALL